MAGEVLVEDSRVNSGSLSGFGQRKRGVEPVQITKSISHWGGVKSVSGTPRSNPFSPKHERAETLASQRFQPSFLLKKSPRSTQVLDPPFQEEEERQDETSFLGKSSDKLSLEADMASNEFPSGSLSASAVGFPLKANEIDASRFIKLKLLGKGAIGRVYLCRVVKPNNERSSRLYAVKVVSKTEMINKQKIHRVMTEREILATTSHPYIVGMFASFQTESMLYYVMEYMAGGEFFRLLQKHPNKRLPETVAKFYAAEVVLALEYLHRVGFIYRDLKPENVLIRDTGHIAIADFDLSKQGAASNKRVDGKVTLRDKVLNSISKGRTERLDIVNSAPVVKGDSSSFVGTEEYLAPEVITGESQTSTVDWWSLGVFVYEMIFGRTPFKGAEQTETFENIVGGEVKFPTDVTISKDGKDFIKKLLTRDAAKRLGSGRGSTAVKEHKWFSVINFNQLRETEPPYIPEVEYEAKWEESTRTLADMEKVGEGAHEFGGFNTYKSGGLAQ
mmetsp:Transcript_8272/g.14972  ORF Transcript_8272/g.14972 Transcript_8272/m.14972 type:complete len:503 (-) Transcript_8272:846-2354(-)|eukprot:CAMPEP_0182447446 /NCGR_PEP_ID=MMETSP1172-20130603/16133_1 /TAXON_ID=708627 /ORGANISM="Timspurckia oligopyrenoides, Strain CCMP3278" /LENGTH=502 /DNA_ID=CAMNT_0024643889 /DNA_START=79 /DNA_END=1587 /DNA_ORIENTATION=+